MASGVPTYSLDGKWPSLHLLLSFYFLSRVLPYFDDVLCNPAQQSYQLISVNQVIFMDTSQTGAHLPVSQ
jgi:hypothetical protein